MKTTLNTMVAEYNGPVKKRILVVSSDFMKGASPQAKEFFSRFNLYYLFDYYHVLNIPKGSKICEKDKYLPSSSRTKELFALPLQAYIGLSEKSRDFMEYNWNLYIFDNDRNEGTLK